MIKAKLDIKQWLSFRLRWVNWTKERKAELEKALNTGGWLIATRAQTKYLTGASLRVQTGRLRASVTVKPKRGAEITGNKYSVQVGTNVFYGRAWENGFSVPAKEIRPKTKKALKIPVGGSKRAGSTAFVLRKKFIRQAYSVKARPWLRPAMEDMKSQIIKLLEQVGVKFK